MDIVLKMIRHGMTQPNMERRFLGWTDAPLCEQGIGELKEQYPEAMKEDAVFSSPLMRCRQTAEIVFGEKDPIIIENFKEMNFGDFEMKNHAELDGRPLYQAWIDSNATIAFPNGEDRKSFTRRTMEGFYGMLDICVQKGLKNVAAAVHGGTLMAVLSSVSDQDYFSFLIENGHGYELEISYDNKTIRLTDFHKI